MSKLRIRTVFGDHVRVVELNRGDAAIYNNLKDEVGQRHEVRAFNLKYVSAALGEVPVVDNESLHKVIRDSEMRMSLAIELRVQSGDKPAPVAKQASYQEPARTPSTPTQSYSSPAQPTPSPSHTVSSPRQTFSPTSDNVQGVIHTFVLPGDSSSANPDKVSVKANQEDDHFLFVPQPAKYTSEVTVDIEGSKLSFQSITKHPDGRIFQFKQGFALPFSTIPAHTIEILGYNIKINF